MKVKETIKSLILSLFLLLSYFLISLNSTRFYVNALEPKQTYTGVLEDLQKDKNFSEENYLENSEDVSLSVIQIAESENKELFIYVYQPCLTEDLTATTISLSTGIKENAKWELYNLTLLNSEKTLFKYKLENFVVKDDAVRYYDISEIHRKFNKNVDAETGNDNTINEVAFKVAQLWTACTVNNETTYVQTKNDVIEITDKYVDFLRYPQATWFGGLNCDSHYVAFSTDHNIENLYEVDISFVTRTFKKTYQFDISGEQIHSAMITADNITNEYGEYINNSKTFTYEDKVDYEIGNGWGFTTKYNWKRVQSVESFIKEVEENDTLKVSFTTTAQNNLKNKQWVLRFFESEYKDNASYIGPLLTKRVETGTDVEQVTILRLKFESNGIVYNLGVVDNKQTGDENPGNTVITNYEEFWRQVINFFKYNWKYIVYGILAIIALIIIAPFMPMIITGLVKLIITIFKGLWWAICLPFNLFRKNTEDINE